MQLSISPGGFLAAIAARLGTSLAYGVLTLMLVLAAAGLLVAALWLWLATLLPPAVAALISGVVVFAVAGIVTLTGRSMVRRRATIPVQPLVGPAGSGAVPPGMASALGSELGAAGSAWLRGHLPQVVIGAAVAGFLVGVSPRLRASLWRLLR